MYSNQEKFPNFFKDLAVFEDEQKAIFIVERYIFSRSKYGLSWHPFSSEHFMESGLDLEETLKKVVVLASVFGPCKHNQTWYAAKNITVYIAKGIQQSTQIR